MFPRIRAIFHRTEHSRHMIRAFLFLSVLLCIILNASHAVIDAAETSQTVILTDDTRSRDLETSLEIMEDPSNRILLRDILDAREKIPSFARSGDRIPNFGFTRTSFWLRCGIQNGTKQRNTWFLLLDYPHQNLIEVFLVNENGLITAKKPTGDTFPFANREVRHHTFVFPIPLQGGETTTMYMRVSGECSKQFPLSIWSPAGFAEKVTEEKFTLGIYYGIVIVMALYNLILFLFIRDRSYLYYVLYILSYALVQMAYNGLAYRYFWPNYPWWHNRSLPFLIGASSIMVIIFSRSFLQTRQYAKTMDRLGTALIIISGMLMLYSLAGSYLPAIQASMVSMLFASLLVISMGIISLRRQYRPARFFLIAWISFLVGILLIALNKLHVIPVMFISEYGMQIGSALEVTLLSFALADRINLANQERKSAQQMTIKLLTESDRQKDAYLEESRKSAIRIENLNRELELKVRDLDNANRDIRISEEKYRMLLEGTNDIVFSLDESWNFLSVSPAVFTQLKISPDELIGRNFLDLVFEGIDGKAVAKNFVREKLESLCRDRKPVTFKSEFKWPIINEPREMQTKLEYINIQGKNEIVGKTSGIEEDTLMKYFEFESQGFSIGNYLITAEDISHRMTRNLVKFLEPRQINLVRLAIREMIINAIEHGNLGISFSEKNEAIMNDNYFEFIGQRQQDPRYSEKRIWIRYAISAEEAVFTIRDEGEGFDHRRITKERLGYVNREMLANGRGIVMTQNIFDEVTYNEKGNEVTLRKILKDSPKGEIVS